jgi:hypothetical protein
MVACGENGTGRQGTGEAGQVDDLYALPAKDSMESGRPGGRG